MADVTVGVLKTMLTMDTASFDAGSKKAAQGTQAVKESVTSLSKQVQQLTPQAERMVKSFGGDKLLYTANSLTAAVTKLGGAQKLTEAEMRRVNATLDAAIAKYKQLGQEAPKAMIELANATRKVEASTSVLSKQQVAIGAAIGTAVGNVGVKAVTALGTAFINAASKGGQLVAVSSSFDRLTGSINESAAAMLAASRSATRGMVTDLDLMQAANKAILLGLPITTREMATLSKTAVALGRAMGLDATTALNDLITALGRSSPLILDNLGLTVKVGEANEAYARSLGKTADELTDAEKKLAFYTAAMDAAAKKTEQLGDVTPTMTEEFKRLATSADNAAGKFAAGANSSGLFAGALGYLADQAEKAADMMDLAAAAKTRLESRGLSGSPGFFTFNAAQLAEINKLLFERAAQSVGSANIPRSSSSVGAPNVKGDPLNTAAALIERTDDLAVALRRASERATAAANEAANRWRAYMNFVGERLMDDDAAALAALRSTLRIGDLGTDDPAALLAEIETRLRAISTLTPLDIFGDLVPQAASAESLIAQIGDDLEAWEAPARRMRDIFRDIFSPIVGGVGDAFGDLLFGDGTDRRKPARGSMSAEEYTRAMREFESRWDAFWGRLARTMKDWLRSMLSMFVQEFLGGMISAIARTALGQRLGNWIATALGWAGGIGGGGALASSSVSTSLAMNAVPGSTATAGAGGGIGSGLAAAAPYLAIPAAFYAAFELLNGPNREGATGNFGLAVTPPRSFSMGGWVAPNTTVPAVLHGGSHGEAVIPMKQIADAAQSGFGSRGPTHIHQWHVSALDGPSFREFLKRGGASEIAFAAEHNVNNMTSRFTRAQRR